MKKLKKLLSFLMALVMIVGMFPVSAMAEVVEGEGETLPICEYCHVELKEGAIHSVACPTNCTCEEKPAEGEAHGEACPLNLNSGLVAASLDDEIPGSSASESTAAPSSETATSESTAAPSTEAPTTESTAAPSTEAPTTESTAAPSTEAPTTESTAAPTEEQKDQGPKVGDKLWIKAGSKIYAATDDTTGYAVKLPYHVKITAIETVGEASWYKFEFADISALLGALFLKDYSWVPAADTTEVKPEDIENVIKTVESKFEDALVQIHGEMPQDVQLFLDEVPAPDALMDMISAEPEHVAFSLDITLAQVNEAASGLGGRGGAAPMDIWQPEEGKPVTVTMEVPGCDDGNIIAVYHEDGETGEVELVGTYPVKEGKIEFDAESFSTYTGVVVHFQTNVAGVETRFTYKAGETVEINDLLSKFGILSWFADNQVITQANYDFITTACYNDDTIDTGLKGLQDSGYVYDMVNNTTTYTLNYPAGIYVIVNIYNKGHGGEAAHLRAAFTFQNNLYTGKHGTSPDTTLCFLLDSDGKFYWYDEATSTRVQEMPFVTLEEAAYSGWNKFNYSHVKILMNNTYQAGKPVETLAQTDMPKRVRYEEIVPGAGQTLLIQRYDGFKNPLIRVEGNPNSPLDVHAGVTIDNKSAAGENLTAVEVVNKVIDGASIGGLFIIYGTITDSNVNIDNPSEYRGIGVYVTHCDPSKRADSNGGKATSPVNRDEGGILELENGCTISGFAIGVKQDYGTTAITYRAPGINNTVGSAAPGSMDLTKNGKSIVLYHNNRIEKWSTYANGIPGLSLYLEDIERWKNGDIILSSGYEWRKNPAASSGSLYEDDGNGTYDHYRTPVVAADNTTGIHFENTNEFHYAMGLEYFHPYEEDDTKNQFKDPNNVQFHEPYPVIRFRTQTVYNTRSHNWYYTLGEAVAGSQPNDELVFYGNTQESGTVTIPHNLTIRSSYVGEKPYANAQGIEPIPDVRAGGNYTATWVRADTYGSAINIEGATVNFEGAIDLVENDDNENDKVCGTLTLDANKTGRVVIMHGGTCLNMEDGITLTNGLTSTISWPQNDGGAIYVWGGGIVNIFGGVITSNTAVGNGGAIYNTGSTVNVSGGTFSNNTANGNGDGIYQGGIFNLSGDPTFSDHAHEDVYLPASATSDVASGFNVITKAGDFTFTNAINVTLGNADTNLYHGRNVVESNSTSNILESDLNLFEVTNTKVQKEALTASDRDKFQFIYTESDETPSSHQSNKVLELYQNISYGSITLKKVVEKEYDHDDLPDGSYTFTITTPHGTGAMYKIGESGTVEPLPANGQITLTNGQTVTISNIPLGDGNDYTITEATLSSADFDTPTWTVPGTEGSKNYTVSGDLTADSATTPVELICTNLYKRHLGDLVITKEVDGTIPDAPAFIFNVKGGNIDMDVTIAFEAGKTENSVTIKDLPIGTYTVTEKTGWAGKYTPMENTPITVPDISVTATQAGQATFTNVRNTKWLTWDTNRNNLFTGFGSN